MRSEILGKLSWWLIYSGLLFSCLGLFVLRRDEAIGWTLVAAGAADALVGIFLLWLRSRRAA